MGRPKKIVEEEPKEIKPPKIRIKSKEVKEEVKAEVKAEVKVRKPRVAKNKPKEPVTKENVENVNDPLNDDKDSEINLIETIKRNIIKHREMGNKDLVEDKDMIKYPHNCVCGAGYDTVAELRNHFDNSDSCQEEFNYANEMRLSTYVNLVNLKNEDNIIILIRGLVFVMKLLKTNRKYLLDDKNDFHRLNLQIKNGIAIVIDKLINHNHPAIDDETRAFFEKSYSDYVMLYEKGSYMDEIYQRVRKDLNIMEYVELEKMARDIKARKGSVKMDDLRNEIKNGIVDTRFFHILVEKGFIEKDDLDNVLTTLQRDREISNGK